MVETQREMIEKRDSRRVPKTESVRITLPEGDTVMGTMQNISRGGVLVAMAEELEPGLIYGIELTDTEGTLSLLGEALRVYLPLSNAAPDEAGMFKVAFEFLELDDSAARRFGRLIGEIES